MQEQHLQVWMAEQMLVDLAVSSEHAQAVGWDASEDRVWVEWTDRIGSLHGVLIGGCVGS